MPRTPRAESYFPVSQPSSVVQIQSDASVSNALQQAGGALSSYGSELRQEQERLQRERQQHKDRIASIEFKNNVRISSQEFDNRLKQARTEEEIDAIAIERANHFDGIASSYDVSPEQADVLRAEAEYQNKASAAIAEAYKTNLIQSQEKAALNASLQLGIIDRDADAVRSTVGEMYWLTPDQQELAVKTSLAEMSQSEAGEFDLAIVESKDKFELGAVEESIDANSVLSDKQKSTLKNRIRIKRNQMATASYAQAKQIFDTAKMGVSGAMAGTIPDRETAINMGMDPKFTDSVLMPVIDGVNGSSGLGSEEFKKVETELDDLIKAQGKMGPFEDDIEPEDLNRFYKTLDDSSLSFDARLRIGAKMASAFKYDAAGGTLGIAVGDYDLDSGQQEVVTRAQTAIFDRILNKKGEVKPRDVQNVSFADSLLDPIQTSFLFDKFSDPAFLEQFKGLSGPELEKAYEELAKPEIVNAVKNSIQSQVRESIESLRPIR